jgi:hypothetical protein
MGWIDLFKTLIGWLGFIILIDVVLNDGDTLKALFRKK